ncbi:hypothetical protein DPMN_067024 [Dreissena polymorpha]|uniref:Uncharacterized protein n=1 Tax=Dreissena polymorpha TaxID=45954 RepID=A0A9D4BT81_DREPO|nr:hypothetical protein DPMN_067024 [Dreissena polymorpha]
MSASLRTWIKSGRIFGNYATREAKPCGIGATFEKHERQRQYRGAWKRKYCVKNNISAAFLENLALCMCVVLTRISPCCPLRLLREDM